MPLLRVLRGSADEDEIAALVTALAAVTAAEDESVAPAPAPRRPEWVRSGLPGARPSSWRTGARYRA